MFNKNNVKGFVTPQQKRAWWMHSNIKIITVLLAINNTWSTTGKFVYHAGESHNVIIDWHLEDNFPVIDEVVLMEAGMPGDVGETVVSKSGGE